MDCIIVTLVYYYDEIYSMLREKMDIPIISIEAVMERDKGPEIALYVPKGKRQEEQ